MIRKANLGKARMRFSLILMMVLVSLGIAFSQNMASIVVLPFTGDNPYSVDSLQTIDTSRREQQQSNALESLRAGLNETPAERAQKQAKARTWGWVSLGVGAASATLMGVSWYLSDVAYQEYQSTSDTATAVYYRRQVLLWDTFMLVSGGTVVLSLGISIPLFVINPDSRAGTGELKRVGSGMAALASAEGIEK